MIDLASVEFGVVSAAIREKQLLLDVSQELDEYHFIDVGLEYLWTVALLTLREYGELPDDAVFEIEIEKARLSTQGLLRTSLARLLASPPSESLQAHLKILRNRSTEVAALHAIRAASYKIEQGDPNEAVSILSRAGIESRPSPKVEGLFDDDGGWRPKAQIYRLGTGLYELDCLIGGLAPEEGELGMISATSGVGKSCLCTTIIHQTISKCENILHIDTENGKQKSRARLMSRFTGVPHVLIETGSVSRRDNETIELWKGRNQERLDAYFRFCHLGMDEYSLDDIEAAIHRQIVQGWRPRIVIIDSPDHLVLTSTNKHGEVFQTEDEWKALKRLWTRLKRLAQRYKVGLWVTTQASLSFEGKVVTAAATADFKGKIRPVDVALSLNLEVDKETGLPVEDDRRRIYIMKNRNGKARVIVPVMANLSIMHMWADGYGPDDNEEQFEDQPQIEPPTSEPVVVGAV